MITEIPLPVELANLKWSEPQSIGTRNGPMLLKKAEPSEQFWNLYREHKNFLNEAGISVSKFQDKWSVNWWARGIEFIVPKIPSLIPETEPLELKPLVNENHILGYQKPLVQQTVAAMLRYGATLNGCTTGVGKTYITLAAARELSRRLLVICPKGIVPDWQRAAYYMGVELAGCYGWEWIKTGKTPFGAFEKIVKPVKGGGERILKGDFVWNVPSDTDLVFDEIHRASAIDTQNAHLVMQAVNQKRSMYALSATIANDPTKMRATGFMLGLHKDGRDYYDWMRRHGVKEIEFNVGRRLVKTYKFRGSARHLQAIHHSIFPHKGCRIRADQLGDQFPETQILAKAYEMDEASDIRKAYEDMEYKVEEIMSKKMSASERQACVLVEILRARQRVELLKVPMFISLTRDFIEEGNSVFIAVNFKDTLNELVEALKIKSIIRGGQKDTDRRNALDDFQSNKTNIIAGIIQACREGLNLHDLLGGHPRVSLISPTPSAFNLKQVLGRVHRAGGKSPSLQRIVFTAGTIEEEVCHSIATKLDCLDLLMDGDLQKGIFPNSYSEMRPEDSEE